MKTGKLVLEGKIVLLSPAIIGSGKSERTDIDLIRDSNGKPFIPATSFVGVLRHMIKVSGDKESYKRFWGSESDKDEDTCQSALYCRDLKLLGDYEIALRDGVAIDNAKGIAKDKAKYDYEVLERDTSFDLYLEVDLIKGYEEFFKRMVATIISLLKKGSLSIGAKTNSGFGRLKLEGEKIYEFNFSKKEDILRWLKNDFSLQASLDDFRPFEFEENNFQLKATFDIKNSLIVRSYTGDPDAPDAVHIQSKDQPVLPGTSLKGAIRSRAERIMRTLNEKEAEGIVDSLFGYVKEEKKDAKKGRIIIEETILPAYPSEVQTRIKIDRFTGGVMESALLETMPLFRGEEDKAFEIKITIRNCESYEAGLMLLILKDLWTGDLPIGGEKAIGRGVLKGKSAEITFNGKTYTINEDLSISPEGGLGELQKLVDSLHSFVEKGVYEEVCND